MVLETGSLSYLWHWKNTVLCCFLDIFIAQIPEKMKGFGIGLMLAFSSLIKLIISEWSRHLSFTVCYDVPTVVLFVVLFVTAVEYFSEQSQRDFTMPDTPQVSLYWILVVEYLNGIGAVVTTVFAAEFAMAQLDFKQNERHNHGTGDSYTWLDQTWW